MRCFHASLLYRVVQKMSARLRELTPSSVARSRNLANIFLDIPVYSVMTHEYYSSILGNETVQ